MTHRNTILLATAALALSLRAQTGADAQIRRGGYLVRVFGCSDCHTPLKMGPKGPEPDLARGLSGHPAGLKITAGPDLGKGPWVWSGAGTNTAFAGPWGVSFTANLTPDKETGIGEWTEQMFMDTVRSGRHLGKGRPVLPPMPIQALANATDEDLKAIFAYLKSQKPMSNRVPDPLDPPQAPQH
ncbi:MAG TPA: hypothetical protein VJ483_02825 [Holophagaceae bacterium]|nr:hypothetical protein [Holophagaceae bacterium]